MRHDDDISLSSSNEEQNSLQEEKVLNERLNKLIDNCQKEKDKEMSYPDLESPQLLESSDHSETSTETDHSSKVEYSSLLENVAPSQAGNMVPGKTVYLIGKNSNLLNIIVNVNGIPVSGIIDTGAQRSLLSSKICDQFDFNVHSSKGSFNVIGETEFKTFGRTDASICLGNVEMGKLQLVVFPEDVNNNLSIVLGSDFLDSNKLDIKVKDRILIKHCSDGSTIQLLLEKNGELTTKVNANIPCYATQSIKLTNGNMHKVPVSFDGNSIDVQSMLVYTDTALESRLEGKVRGIEGITSVETKYIYVFSSEGNVMINKGDRLGSVNSVVEALDDEEPDCVFDGWEETVKLADLNTEQQNQVFSMLRKHSKVFSHNDKDIGLAGVTKHKIILTDDTPIYQRPRRVPQPMNEELERQCQELSEADIIEPSASPWAAPIVPVRKRDGSLRMCIDYRKLNAVTVPDKFPVPNLVDSIYGLSGTKYFSKLDLVRGYYQVPLEENSRQYTAFSTCRNHWQFKRLSFGLRNAPAAFQREIQAVLSAFPSNKVIAYIDDILIMSSTFQEHVDLVSKVLQTLQNFNIKLKTSKCEWFRSEVEFLGHIVSSSGIRKTPEYMNRVDNYPRPKTVGELREFLGFINFQRKFLPHCSTIQKPLSCLTSGNKSKSLEWTDEMVNAFEAIKSELKVELELSFPDYSDTAAKLELYVDASAVGSGAYLAQWQDGKHRVIGFASMTFTPTQRNYAPIERELTALRWGVKSFRPFLIGVEFVLYTDHQPLVHLHNMKLVCSRLMRTVQELSEYVPEIRYVPGRVNLAADALSRLNYKVPEYNDNYCATDLPDGLVHNGQCSPGGGDSLFHSLMKALTSLKHCRMPATVDELRSLLVGDLVEHPDRYQLKLNRDSRKMLKLMRLPGQIPTLDVILVACRLFHIKVHVYFWSNKPVIYQYNEEDINIVHLQCISGIHFNALIEVRDYVPPDPQQCAINAVISVMKPGNRMSGQNPVPMDDLNANLEPINFIDNVDTCELTKCDHLIESSPIIHLTIGNFQPCALVDTGAELSLVSERTLKIISDLVPVEIIDERLCDIEGFSGKTCPIERVAFVKFSCGSYEMKTSFKFGVVSDDILPYCFLLGLDFLIEHDVFISYNKLNCHFYDSVVAFETVVYDVPKVCVVTQGGTGKSSHVVIPKLEDDLRFEIMGESSTVSGLSMLVDDDTIKTIQKRCAKLRSLHKNLRKNVPTKDWSSNLNEYRRFVSKLKIIDDVLVYGDSNVIVVPFNVVLELTISVHFNFAHIGRDKLSALLFDLVWHPSKLKVIADVCTTCFTCQVFKDNNSAVIPPTLKIITSYPFELVAADLMSLPKTNSGYVALLVVVDHFSKFVAAVPLKNKQSATVIKAFVRNVLPFLPCIPINVLTDNGPEFISEEFSEFLTQSGINHKLTIPYCPTSNGAVERVNKTVQNLIKTLLAKDENNWDEHLSRAIIAYNNSPHSAISMSPSRYLITQSHNHCSDPPLQSQLRQYWKVGHPKFLPFKINDKVLMKVQHKGFLNVNKFLPKYDGPLKVIRVDSFGVSYQLLDDNGKVYRAHHAKLKFFKDTPSYISNNPIYCEFLNKNQDVGEDNVIVPNDDTYCTVPNETINLSPSDDTDSDDLSSVYCSDPDADFSNTDSSGSDTDSDTGTISRGDTGCILSRTNECNVVNVLAQNSGGSIEPMIKCKICEVEDAIERSLLLGSLMPSPKMFRQFSARDSMLSNNSCRTIIDVTHRLLPDCELEILNGSNLGSGNPIEVFPDIGPAEVSTPNDERIMNRYSQSSSSVISSAYTEINVVDVLDWQVSSTEDTDNEFDNPQMIRDVLNEDIEESFVGFGASFMQEENLLRLNEIRQSVPSFVASNPCLSSNKNVRHTRSQGPVKDYPNVQTNTLERKRHTTGDGCQK